LFIGCGSWGGTLGSLLCEKGYCVTMWHRDKEIVKYQSTRKIHYLISELSFPKNISFTSDIKKAIKEAEIVVLALPTQIIREILNQNKTVFNSNQILVNLSKGIEINTLMTISEVIDDELGGSIKDSVVLSGPSHAEEVIKKHPTALVAASKNLDSAKIIQELFFTDMLRIYLSDDIKGVEIGGAMKNVIAIASGICDGLGYGDNPKAALATRGMSEIIRLGKEMGAKQNTFMGLSGYGDLIVTCLSKYSRNRNLGQKLGEGILLNKAISDMNMIAEGVDTAKSAHQLSKKYKVKMPIHEAIYKVLFRRKNPTDAVYELMNRQLSTEFD